MTITFDDLFLSVISALIGLVITLPVTYLVVDRIVERQAKKEVEPVEKMAKERLRSKLGVGFLTTFLITLVIDVTTSFEEKKPIGEELLEIYITKLKAAQSDLEMLLGIYNHVLSVEVAHHTGNIILGIEHLQEDFQYLAEIHPKPPTRTLFLHIEDVILRTVHLTKLELEDLGEDDTQIKGLEEWLVQSRKNRPITHEAEQPIKVSGKHTIV